MNTGNRRLRLLTMGALAIVAAFAMAAAAQPGGRGYRQGAPDGQRGLRGAPQEDGQRWGGPPHGGPERHGPSIEELDTDGDGVLSFAEVSVLPRMDEEHFNFLDRNGDSLLDETEFPPRRGPRGGRGPRLAEVDADGDGNITWEEASVLPHMDEEHFHFLDRNDDGVISGDELPLGPPPGGMGPRRPPFEDLDTDGNGALSFEEASVLPRMTAEHFAEMDANEDGELTREELPVPHGPRGRRGGFQQHDGAGPMQGPPDGFRGQGRRGPGPRGQRGF